MHGRLARLACTLSDFKMWSFTSSDVFPSVLEVTTAALSTVLDINGLKIGSLITGQARKVEYSILPD